MVTILMVQLGSHHGQLHPPVAERTPAETMVNFPSRGHPRWDQVGTIGTKADPKRAKPWCPVRLTSVALSVSALAEQDPEQQPCGKFPVATGESGASVQ